METLEEADLDARGQSSAYIPLWFQILFQLKSLMCPCISHLNSRNEQMTDGSGELEEGLSKVTKTVCCLQRDLNTALVVSVPLGRTALGCGSPEDL